MFFFSCRRRHTSFSRDWSSDVCSSDLGSLRGGDRRRGGWPPTRRARACRARRRAETRTSRRSLCRARRERSEEHTSELQSREKLVCRLLLEKKNKAPCALTTTAGTREH